jgi:hypothetical protein
MPKDLWYVAKFALGGALILGSLALVHVWWEGYEFAASDEVPVDDVRYVTVSITALGVIVGAILGTLAGAVTAFVKRRRRHE